MAGLPGLDRLSPVRVYVAGRRVGIGSQGERWGVRAAATTCTATAPPARRAAAAADAVAPLVTTSSTSRTRPATERLGSKAGP